MAESFLIALREGFEAALIVAIVLAFVRRRAPEKSGAVWLGAAAALLIAVVIGVVLQVTVDGLEGEARLRTFAVICLAAAGLLTWMIFWMRTHARSLKGELEGRASEAIAVGSGFALGLVAFTAVLREGLETALFLLSTAASSDGASIVIGTLLGLTAACVLGVLVYAGSHRLNLRLFFQITGVLIILFAAGLVARAVQLFQAAGDLGSFNDAVYNLTGVHWLTVQSQTGRFLAGIFGWDPRPSIEQVIAYLAYLVPALVFFFRAPRPARPLVPASPPAAAERVPTPAAADEPADAVVARAD
jgi:high-affinity iron transporter